MTVTMRRPLARARIARDPATHRAMDRSCDRDRDGYQSRVVHRVFKAGKLTLNDGIGDDDRPPASPCRYEAN